MCCSHEGLTALPCRRFRGAGGQRYYSGRQDIPEKTEGCPETRAQDPTTQPCV